MNREEVLIKYQGMLNRLYDITEEYNLDMLFDMEDVYPYIKIAIKVGEE